MILPGKCVFTSAAAIFGFPLLVHHFVLRAFLKVSLPLGVDTALLRGQLFWLEVVGWLLPMHGNFLIFCVLYWCTFQSMVPACTPQKHLV